VKNEGKKLKTAFFILCLLVLQDVLLSAPCWLQYKTSRYAQEEFGSWGMNYHRFSDKPNDVKFPKFDGYAQHFAKWQHSMENGQFRWVAFDQSKKNGLCDILYIDSNGDGNLDDEKPYQGIPDDRYRMYFGPVPVYFQGEDGPITYHLTFMYYSSGRDSIYWSAITGCWYEGDIVIDGKKNRIALCDHNSNGTFSDKSEHFDSDRVYLKSGNQWKEYYVGNYVEIEDKLYNLSVAKDGAFFELRSAEGVVYGTVKMADNINTFSAGGVNGFYERKPKDGLVKLPEGTYEIYRWQIERKDGKGKNWTLAGSGFDKFSFTVSKDTVADLDIGEPVFSRITHSQSKDNTHNLNQELRGKLNERISLTVAGNRPEAPSVLIRSRTGEYDRTFKLEYG